MEFGRVFPHEKVWLSNVQCGGSEENLADCTDGSPAEPKICDSNRAASVICDDGMKKFNYYNSKIEAKGGR